MWPLGVAAAVILLLLSERREKVAIKFLYPLKAYFLLNPERELYRAMIRADNSFTREAATEEYIKAKIRRKFIRQHREFRKAPHEWVETLLPRQKNAKRYLKLKA